MGSVLIESIITLTAALPFVSPGRALALVHAEV